MSKKSHEWLEFGKCWSGWGREDGWQKRGTSISRHGTGMARRGWLGSTEPQDHPSNILV